MLRDGEKWSDDGEVERYEKMMRDLVPAEPKAQLRLKRREQRCCDGAQQEAYDCCIEYVRSVVDYNTIVRV